ncbi:hypothetical protein [Nonomuraea endophytica]|uniref:Uncharacterized protein n=1 Tax=Nonomuraea endophytica TaxID=714136 RepID=A0A7W8ABN2_9ACTN|nr:hypothetical protein [Nonomuraea endophytica]MBB5083158.1 hypothetical protein [Nonomuraea endophytica]
MTDAKEPEEAEQPDPPENTKSEESEEPEDIDESALNQSATVINNFLGYVDASAARFGMGGGVPVRATTRDLDPAEIAGLLTNYLEPEAFAPALEDLAARHLIVVSGDEEIGKRVGAIALLSRMPLVQGRITVLSPARTLAELATQTEFKPGRAYLLHDWIAAGTESAAVRAHELARLAGKLVEIGSFLVLTRAGGQGRDEHAWNCPDLGELFDVTVGAPPGRNPEELSAARERAVELPSPARVVALARRVAADPRPVAELLAEEEGGEVAAWFDAKPSREDVHLVAVLAFAYRMPERIFESELSRLSAIRAELEGDLLPPQVRDAEPQSRMAWSREHPLVTVVAEGSGAARERRVVFKGVHHRRQVIAELVGRYGFTLWQPLRAWVRSLAASGLELQIQVSAGVAILAGVSLTESCQEFLDVWASGSAMERLAAANTISIMCADDALAPEALTLALSWVADVGQARAMTAALALGGGLAIRYPADTVNWLWFLALRAVRVNVVARRSLALLFRQAAEREDASRTVLRLLRVLVATEMSETGSIRTRKALDVVVDLLEADTLDGTRPLAERMLTTGSGCAAHLGRLWAWALSSGHHRGHAIRALRRVLIPSSESGAAAVAAVSELGEAIWAHLPAELAEPIEQRLRHALGDAGGAERSHILVQALLSAGSRHYNHQRLR